MKLQISLLTCFTLCKYPSSVGLQSVVRCLVKEKDSGILYLRICVYPSRYTCTEKSEFQEYVILPTGDNMWLSLKCAALLPQFGKLKSKIQKWRK